MRIKYLLFDTDLRMSQIGLKKTLTYENLKLNKHEFALFLNSKRDMFKLLSSDNVVLISYKSPYGRIQMQMLKDLHLYWDGTSIDIARARKTSLKKELARKKG